MPLGRLSEDQVFGQSPGWRTGDERDKITRLQATAAIQRWEKVTASDSSTAEQRKAATWAVVWAMFPNGRKSFVLNGKRYKVISNAKVTEIRVTPAPPKTGAVGLGIANREKPTVDRDLLSRIRCATPALLVSKSAILAPSSGC
jgi:hypothetical protein